MKPIIGISQCLDDRGRWRRNREYLYLDSAYARAVEAAGGIAMHLPIQRDADGLLRRIDALLLPGGDDLPPESPYPADVPFDPAPARQIEFDRRLLAGALHRALPLLGVCYGMQLLALHQGGRLHYHLPLDLPTAQTHQLPNDDDRHPLIVEANTKLASTLGRSPAPVNSLHHQAVAAPGHGLRVCARSPDGVVEAIESEDEAFCMGVQWHPEKLEGHGRDAIFGALVAAAARASKTGPHGNEVRS